MEGSVLASLTALLAPHGLILRGGFHPDPQEDLGATLLLVGNAGAAMWQSFEPHIDDFPDPLNRWTREVMEPIAAEFGALPRYPFGEPQWPFQRWAARAEILHPSPLGLLIHPEFGLWHAWRAALAFADLLPLPPPSTAPSPCENCREKPCLSACPVGAFTGHSYDVPACAAHLASPAAACPEVGCHARNACPVGAKWRYPDAQIRFHMAAFARSVAAPGRTGTAAGPAR
jgi:ferredoxin